MIRLEKGRREAKASELEKIAEAVGCPVSYLLGIDDAPPLTSDVTPVIPSRGRLIAVPLLSPEMTACCGSGIPMYEELQNEPEEIFKYTISELGGVYDDLRPPFACRAEGACLEKSHIFDGDVLIANPALVPQQGKICIVNWGGSLSAKKVVRQADGGVQLFSDADAFSVPPDEAGDPERFRILGQVVALRRAVK